MADLTSTISISGTIGGKSYKRSSVFTLEDVYDYGQATADDTLSAMASASFRSTNAAGMNFSQDCPSYLLAANNSVSQAGMLSMNNPGGSKLMSLILAPGQFVVLLEYTQGAGIITTNTTASTSKLEEIDDANFGTIADIGKKIKGALFVAFQATT